MPQTKELTPCSNAPLSAPKTSQTTLKQPSPTLIALMADQKGKGLYMMTL